MAKKSLTTIEETKMENAEILDLTKPMHNHALTKNEPVWGAAEDLTSTDLVIAKIFHQQALSKFASDGAAAPGDWCDSLTGEILAKRDQELQLIIFSSFKKLLISKLEGSAYKWSSTEDVTPANALLPWEEVLSNGDQIRRQLQYNYFGLLVNKLDEMPYVLSFQSSKIKAAKKLNTMFAKLSRLNLPSAAYIFNFKSVKETGEKGSWYGVEVSQGEKTNTAQQEVAFEWYQKLKTARVTVAEGVPEQGGDDIPF